jgi:hypothetical protein
MGIEVAYGEEPLRTSGFNATSNPKYIARTNWGCYISYCIESGEVRNDGAYEFSPDLVEDTVVHPGLFSCKLCSARQFFHGRL